MAEPIPPVDDSFLRANEAIAALKKTRPRNVTEARNRAVELSRLNDILSKAAKEVAETHARARVANGNGAGNGGEHFVLTTAHLPELAKAIVPFVKELITEAVAECLRDGGTWQKEVMYQPNQVVTSDGTLWICKQVNANAKPPGDCWRQLHRTIGRR
jgi:hypothetical protein